MDGTLDDLKDPLLNMGRQSQWEYVYDHRDLGDLHVSGDNRNHWTAHYSVDSSQAPILAPVNGRLSATADSNENYDVSLEGGSENVKSHLGYSTVDGVHGHVGGSMRAGPMQGSYALSGNFKDRSKYALEQHLDGVYAVTDKDILYASVKSQLANANPRKGESVSAIEQALENTDLMVCNMCLMLRVL